MIPLPPYCSRWLVTLLACSVFAAAESGAATVSLLPSADTTLFEVAPNSNLGGAPYVNAGTTAQNGARTRGLFQFDFSAIPSGSLIVGATLTLEVVKQPQGGASGSSFELRRMLQSWGEGEQVAAEPGSPGLGSPAVAGEATWNNRYFGGAAWSVPGGAPGVDYSDQVSSLAPSGAIGEQVIFEGTSTMLADLQFWLNQPSSNFGWMLLTDSETVAKTARQFASSESDFGPILTIDFVPVPEPGNMALTITGAICLAGLRLRSPR